ncbi:hypothetical protein [Bacillus mycoides]|uniref:hypothetical protein n=1 Tax=Bacillus mycoides TaxID=1405 RepID=UPI002E1F72F5|nr:hypothetical protein [Bacillus mycoides]MED1054332.1 hypothetical protein [Bacillus mycoides]
MKKETEIQVNSEIEVVESEIRKTVYHLVGVNCEKAKTERKLQELRDRAQELKSYL